MSEVGILLFAALIGLIYFERFKVSPGGILSAGYLTFFLFEPLIIIHTLLIAFIAWSIIYLLSGYILLFGRRTLLFAIIIGFILSLTSQQLFSIPIQEYPAMVIIGYFVPGEIAYECRRQGILSTLLALSIVILIVKILLLVSSMII